MLLKVAFAEILQLNVPGAGTTKLFFYLQLLLGRSGQFEGAEREAGNAPRHSFQRNCRRHETFS